MSRILIAACLTILATGHALADRECAETVRSIHIQHFDRPAHRAERTVEAFGQKTVYKDIVVDFTRTLSQVNGADWTLVIGKDTWTGPSPDGPWRGHQIHPQRTDQGWQEKLRAQTNAYADNMTDIACLGMVEIDGQTYAHYKFSSRSNPDSENGGCWYGATHEYFVDPSSNLVMRELSSHFTGSYGDDPESSGLTIYAYDESITIIGPKQ